MVTSVKQAYTVSNENSNFMRMLGVGTLASSAATIAGLAGIVSVVFLRSAGTPESVNLANEISTYAVISTNVGAVLSAYFGVNYLINIPLKKKD